MHRSSWLMKSMSPCLSSAPMAGCLGSLVSGSFGQLLKLSALYVLYFCVVILDDMELFMTMLSSCVSLVGRRATVNLSVSVRVGSL